MRRGTALKYVVILFPIIAAITAGIWQAYIHFYPAPVTPANATAPVASSSEPASGTRMSTADHDSIAIGDVTNANLSIERPANSRK